MAKTSDRLTALAVEKAKGARQYLHDGNGLYLKLSKWGTKSWVYRYKIGHGDESRTREMGLGSCRTISLKDARELAKKQRVLRQEGRDPIEARREIRASDHPAKVARIPTFAEALTACIEASEAGWRNNKHHYQWRQSVEQMAFPVMRNLPVDAIVVDHVERALKPFWHTKAETARRTRGRIEKVLAYATAKKWRTGDNPARWRGNLEFILGDQHTEETHYAALDYREIPAFMAKLRAVETIAARALEFTILTTARAGETLGATWPEIDLAAAAWNIPGARMKAGENHSSPLCERALAIVETMPRFADNRHVFPGVKRGRGLSDMTMQKALKTLRPGLTTHGFRSTFRDWAGDATDFPRELAETQLAHAFMGATERAYRRGRALDKRREMLDAWCSYCMSAQQPEVV
jgi:integrase